MFVVKIFIILVMSAGCLCAGPIKTVVIDAGHGGADFGAHRGSVREKDLNLKVAKKLKVLLKARGLNVVMTRETDKALSLDDRADIANRHADAVFVSIHFNAVEKGLEYVKGVETFYYSNEGYKLAKLVQKRMLEKTGSKDRKVRGKNYKVLEKTKCPAILVECGFISNYNERERCAKSWYHSLCASAISEGILSFKKTSK